MYFFTITYKARVFCINYSKDYPTKFIIHDVIYNNCSNNTQFIFMVFTFIVNTEVIHWSSFNIICIEDLKILRKYLCSPGHIFIMCFFFTLHRRNFDT